MYPQANINQLPPGIAEHARCTRLLALEFWSGRSETWKLYIPSMFTFDVSGITVQDIMQLIVSNSWFAFRPRDLDSKRFRPMWCLK
jgi:hypothetical protein